MMTESNSQQVKVASPKLYMQVPFHNIYHIAIIHTSPTLIYLLPYKLWRRQRLKK